MVNLFVGKNKFNAMDFKEKEIIMKNIIKSIIFIILFFLILGKVTDILNAPELQLEYPTIFDEEKNSLDAVYIGSSDCYSFWNPLIAWKNYGITVHPYAFSGRTLLTTEYSIREVRKKQKDAVFIVNINTYGGTTVSVNCMHRVLDYMPLSLNKLKSTKYMTDLRGLSFKESLEYYFPIIRYHGRWKDVKWENLTYKNNMLKGANYADYFLKGTVDISSQYKLTNETEELSNVLKDNLKSLLNYCDEEKIKIIFVIVPRAEDNITNVKTINTMKKIISERGYSVLDLRDKIGDIGIDLKTDYYNKKHTNIHGAVKFTDYVSQYLIENFNFENKSNSAKYVSWDYAYNNYYKSIANYVLDIELNNENRDYSLKAHLKNDIKISTNNNIINITWKSIDGATGYVIYRNEENNPWQRIGVTSDTIYLDKIIKKNRKYNYTIVPYYEKEGKCYYGNYLYNGKKIET